MSITVKICGINSAAAMDAAVEGGAGYVGLMFYPPSPRFLTTGEAAGLARRVPDGVTPVGVFVDAPDTVIAETLAAVPLGALQFHGGETPARVAEARTRFGLPIIKAVRIAGADDIARALDFEDAADIVLFDAKPPDGMAGALPGGNALAFDWSLLAHYSRVKPWALSGGLAVENLAEAVRITGAPMVDVSSGVETAPGVKDPGLIRAFLAASKGL